MNYAKLDISLILIIKERDDLKMTELKTIITDETLLSERADEVDTIKEMKEARAIIAELKSIIRKNKLTSLSAPAIGYGKRIFCVNFSDSEIKTFINPIIVKAEGLVLSDETCTSIPGKRFILPRNNKVSIMYTSPLGKVESREVSGVAASVIQHEIHHLEGIILSDIGLEVDEMFDNATQEEREQVIGMYLDSLDIKQKELDKQIEEDADLKQIADATEFMEKVQSGEVVQEI